MRILILGHNYAPELTGIAPYTTELAEHFAAIGHTVTVLTTFPHYPRYHWAGRPGLFRAEIVGGVDVRRLRVILPRKSNAFWRIIFDTSVGIACLVSAIGAARPNLIIGVVPTMQSGFATGLLSKVWRAPALLLIKDLPLEAGLAVGMLHMGLLFKAGARFERLVYRMAGHIVVIGEQFRDNLVAKGVRPDAITVIPDWIDLDRITPAAAEPGARLRLAGSEDGFLVLHTGSMGEKQGLLTVIDACRSLSEQTKIRVVLVGDGPAKRQLTNAIAELHLDNVRLLEIQPAESFPKMLAAADVLLLMQRAAIIDAVVPSKLLSYMAAGRPIVAAVNPMSVAAKLISDAQCGVLVPPEDPIRLADALRDLAANPVLRADLGRRGREHAEANFNKKMILDDWNTLLTSMA